MTSYLQRLAASAAKREEPIHPVLQPIFSTVTADSGGDHPLREEVSISRAAEVPPQSIERPAEPQRQSTASDASAPVAAIAPKPGPELSLPPAVRARVAAMAPTGTDVAPPPVRRQRRDNPGILQQAGEEPDGQAPDAIRSPAPSPPDLPAPRTNANLDDGARPESGHVRPERIFVPLLASIVSTDEPAPAATARPLPGLGSNRTGAPRRVEGARSAASEPNEVQIHIGRIEVTAVPPAPARPSVATPRRSAMSLEDYLKRRNGRAP